jgi:membrane protein
VPKYSFRSLGAYLHERAHDPRLRRGLHAPVYVARVLVQVAGQWARDRCPQQAASLAYSTALSVVPIIAVVLAAMRAFGEFQIQSTLVDFLSREVLPRTSREDIAGYLVKFAGNLSAQTAGIAGLSTTLILVFITYTSVEKIFNDIWKTERRRSLAQQFMVFYPVATLVPALLGVSLFYAASFGLTQGVIGELTMLAASWAALFVANKLLPATKVAWRAAAVGALLSALAFELAKQAFQLYVARVAFQSYAGIYGALGLVPILLIWIYYTWLVILFGAEVAHSVQNLRTLEDTGRLGGSHNDGVEVTGPIAARLLCQVVRTWSAEGRASNRLELAAALGVDDGVVDRVLARLRAAGMVVEVEGDTAGVLPARPPTDVTLADVLELFRGGDVAGAGAAGAERLDQVLADLDETLRAKGRAVTLDELAR